MDLPANPQPGDRINAGQRLLEWTGARWILVAEQGTLIPGPAPPEFFTVSCPFAISTRVSPWAARAGA